MRINTNGYHGGDEHQHPLDGGRIPDGTGTGIDEKDILGGVGEGTTVRGDGSGPEDHRPPRC